MAGLKTADFNNGGYEDMVGTKKLFSGKLLRLYLKRHRFPSGHIANLEVVVHPGAVLIVPFLDKDRIILIRQYRPVINAYIWGFPAGTLGKAETPIGCAKREIAEEIGYKARRWKRIGHIYPTPGYTTEKIVIYKARGLKKIKSKKEEDEIISARTFTKREIAVLLRSGKIVDAKTICALLLLRIS